MTDDTNTIDLTERRSQHDDRIIKLRQCAHVLKVIARTLHKDGEPGGEREDLDGAIDALIPAVANLARAAVVKVEYCRCDCPALSVPGHQLLKWDREQREISF